MIPAFGVATLVSVAAFGQSLLKRKIEAKAEGEAAPKPEEFRKMVRSLLADRFKLQVHHEQREMRMLALVVGKTRRRRAVFA
jgi:uncharacterized protein (TIGR03435 family)